MTTIIAGRFDEQAQAERAVLALEAAGFPRERIATFFVNPAGQHDRHGTPRDPDASAGAHDAGTGAAAGAATGTGVGAMVGLATMPVLGPVGAVAGAAIGAYVGSLAGALENMGDTGKPGEEPAAASPTRDEALPRKSGMLVAVAVTTEEQARAIGVFGAEGGADIERAHGVIAQRRWDDFDPLRSPALVSDTGAQSERNALQRTKETA